MGEARTDFAGATRSRLRLLDLLRLVAALAVVLFHYTARYNVAWGTEQPQELWAPLSWATAYGVLGVQLFFLISGFVVLMSAWGADVPRFVSSRVSRLFPAYWVGVIATGTLLFLDRSLTIGGSWEGMGLSGFLLNFTMLQSAFGVPPVDGVYWTLWVELKFYVLLALFVLIGITRQRILALAVVWPVLAGMLSGFGLPILDEILMPQHAPFFAAGMLLFLIHREGWTLVSGLALALNWTLMIRSAYVEHIHVVTANTLVPANPTVIAAAFTAFVVVIALVTQTRLARIDWKWLTVAGALTYPLYLLHEIIGWWLIAKIHPGLPKEITLLLVLAGMLVASYAVHRLVERPVAPLLRRKLEAGLRSAPAARAAAVEDPNTPAGPPAADVAPHAPKRLGRRPLAERPVLVRAEQAGDAPA